MSTLYRLIDYTFFQSSSINVVPSAPSVCEGHGVIVLNRMYARMAVRLACV